jgi:hypothetical protein
MSEWISVDDRLPEKCDIYLCFINGVIKLVILDTFETISMIRNDVTRDHMLNEKAKKWRLSSEYRQPTHWMPIPKLPEVKDE